MRVLQALARMGKTRGMDHVEGPGELRRDATAGRDRGSAERPWRGDCCECCHAMTIAGRRWLPS